MRRLLLFLLVAVIGAGLLALACGSGEDVQPSGTEISPREARQATVMQAQQTTAQDEAESVNEQVTAEEPQAETEEQQPAGQEQPQGQDQGQDQDQEAIEPPVDHVGEHKGVRSQRNVLGEPDAPVLIEYYGDFT